MNRLYPALYRHSALAYKPYHYRDIAMTGIDRVFDWQTIDLHIFLFLVHPDDIESREKKFNSELSELSTQVEELLAANMSMKLECSQVRLTVACPIISSVLPFTPAFSAVHSFVCTLLY